MSIFGVPFSLRKVYIIVFSSLILWSLFAYMTMNQLINSHKVYAKIINVAGKQRMFLIKTELLVKDSFVLKNEKSLGELKNLLHLMQNDYEYIKNNLTSKSMKKIYFKSNKALDSKMEKYFSLLNDFLNQMSQKKLDSIETYSKSLLPELNFAVHAFENESVKITVELQKREFLILLGTLITLFLEAIFIVIPAIKYNEKIRLEQKKHEKSLKQRIKDDEDELKHAQTVYDNTHDGIIITNKEMQIINVNKSFEKTTGYQLSDIKYSTPKVLQSGMYDKSFYQAMWKEIDEKGYWEGELVSKKKNSDLYIEWLTISTVFDEKGNVKNYIGVFSDITKQKKQEENLRKQEKILYEQSKMAAMGQMIENIAHQWRQPLSAISTLATGIRLQKENDVISDEEMYLQLDKINESSQYLSKTIDDFRDFLKTDKVKGKFEISEVMRKSINIISSKLKNRNIKIELNFKEVYVEGLRNELQQVFINILNNAKDALVEKELEDKVIFIDIFEKNDNAIIVIKDNAGGIKEEIMDRIFEPYFTTKHQYQGTGIGLYMSLEMINSHMNGKILVKNSTFEYKSKVYKGASFKIEIPI